MSVCVVACVCVCVCTADTPPQSHVHSTLTSRPVVVSAMPRDWDWDCLELRADRYTGGETQGRGVF